MTLVVAMGDSAIIKANFKERIPLIKFPLLTCNVLATTSVFYNFIVEYGLHTS